MAKIEFEAAPFLAPAAWMGDAVMLRLPVEVSEQLLSQGMSMVVGHVNGTAFESAVEPDGDGSHWFRIDPCLIASAGIEVGEPIKVSMEATKAWPEPKVPEDLQEVLAADPQAASTWRSLTPAARWDWIRWATAARQPETRKRRIESIPSRFRSGKRRPCCFDRSQCTLTDA